MKYIIAYISKGRQKRWTEITAFSVGYAQVTAMKKADRYGWRFYKILTEVNYPKKY